MAETISHHASIEQARNAALHWLELRGARFDQNRRIEIGRLGTMEGSETGVSSTAGPCWRLRLDYAPDKGPHYNAEYGKGANAQKHAFCFPGTAELMARIAARRAPR
jgi:hypothetical protein